MLEKAEEQEKLLEESAKELEERQQKAESLRKALEEKEVTLSRFVCDPRGCRDCHGNESQYSAVPVWMERSVAGHLRRQNNIVWMFCWNVDVFVFCGCIICTELELHWI